MTASGSRDRYLDTLRAVALVRVVVFHMAGVAWLSFVLPAMGVMFALGGSLMAASMRRPAAAPSMRRPAVTASMRRPAAVAVRGRIRRLFPALWVMGVILVPVMLWSGWTADDPPLYQLAFWVVPVAQPPGTSADWAQSATEVLWYLVTYLWLVLLSPLAWRMYRRFPVPTVLLPLTVLVATQFGPLGFGGPAGDVLTNVATFGACWFVGFAHRSGQLNRIPTALLTVLAVGLVSAGATWAVTHPNPQSGLNLNDIPLAQALYSLGFVLVVMRLSPSMDWLARIRPLDRAVTVLNARAVTVYLWHNIAIALAFPIGDVLGAWRLGNAGYVVLAVVLIVVTVGALGWVEDLAARRRPALLPSLAPRRPVEVPAVHLGHQPLPAADVGHLAVDRELPMYVGQHRDRHHPAPIVGVIKPNFDHWPGNREQGHDAARGGPVGHPFVNVGEDQHAFDARHVTQVDEQVLTAGPGPGPVVPVQPGDRGRAEGVVVGEVPAQRLEGTR